MYELYDTLDGRVVRVFTLAQLRHWLTLAVAERFLSRGYSWRECGQ